MTRRCGFLLTVVAAVALAVTPATAGADGGKQRQRQRGEPRAGVEHPKLDRELNKRATHGGWSRVIVTLNGSADAAAEVVRLGGRLGRRLDLINGQVVELPNGQLRKLAAHPAVARIDADRPTERLLSRVTALSGARIVQRAYGLDGAGVGVAVVDSGIASWHDDLTYAGTNPAVRVQGNQRVADFVDLVKGAPSAYDDNGHGTHVSGIIAGNGYDSGGAHTGIAPGSHIVSLKVLDQDGRGVISDVIAAFEYAIANRTRHNIRVVNLSVGAAVTSSYRTDPLALAAKRAVDAGLVVVTAAGNVGQNKLGEPQWGGILAPGNAPWVLTVGAFTHKGTINRTDDAVAGFSSSGPTAFDYEAKPDLVASGVGTVSLNAPGSLLSSTKAAYLVSGTVNTADKPYLSLSGTSMAAPVVSGTVALMLQANPTLTPNLVKAILHYTAQLQPDVHPLRQGAGFLNSHGAVELARYFVKAQPGDAYPSGKSWSRKINWGSRRVSHGVISPSANAWDLNTVWGTARRDEGDNIVWGTACARVDCSDVVWGTARLDEGDNIVWGTDCGGNDCLGVVWGTAALVSGFNIVWGTAADDGGDNIVWGTNGLIDTLWGTAADEGDNIVWGTSGSTDALFEDGSDADMEWEALFDPPPVEDGGVLVAVMGAL